MLNLARGHGAALLYRGEITGATPVSSSGDRWVPLCELPAFHLHARKAEAAQRVEREVTGARKLANRRRQRQAVLVIGTCFAAVAGALFLGLSLLTPRPARVSPLLEDFGQGIRVASARVLAGGARRAQEVDVEVEIDPGAPPGGQAAHHPERSSRPVARAAPPEAPSGMVEARFDPARIQAMVNREQHTLVPCFREEAARSGDFAGQVPLEFAIDNDGRVAALWIDEPRFRDGPLRGCLLRALAAWRFDPFPGQRPTVQLAFSIGR